MAGASSRKGILENALPGQVGASFAEGGATHPSGSFAATLAGVGRSQRCARACLLAGKIQPCVAGLSRNKTELLRDSVRVLDAHWYTCLHGLLLDTLIPRNG